MKFLADENFPRPAFQVLRNAGFDISWIADDCPGATDDEVLACCAAQNRTLLTFDKDFGELAFSRSLPASQESYFLGSVLRARKKSLLSPSVRFALA